MKRRTTIVTGAALGFVASVLVAVTGLTAPEPSAPSFLPNAPRDTGAGELLLVVVGGTYPTRAAAEAANAELVFGDLQGYYVVPVAQFQGFREQIAEPDDFALASAFRTEEGAQEFLELAATFDLPATLLPERVRSLGGVFAGLGQETAPDGQGPLQGPVPESLP